MRATFLLSLLLTASAVAFAAPAFAAEESAPKGAGASVAEVVVTAEKREEKIKDVPMAVTAVSGIKLDRLQQQDFVGFAASVPGLSLASQGPGATRVTLRGINSGGIGSTVAVYVDESPFGSSSALLNGGTLAGDFDTWDLQRVEVLSGPQGTLYGANSEGGLIKFVTNAPTLSAYHAALELNDEDVDHGGNGLAVRGMANIPLGSEAALRISGFTQDIPGYINDKFLNVRGVNAGRKYGGRVSLLFNPTDAFSVRFTADGQDIKVGGSTAVDIDPVTLQPVHGAFTQERFLRDRSEYKYQNYNALVNWNLGWATLTSSTSLGNQDANSPSFDYTSVDAAGTITYGTYLSDYLFGEPLSLGFAQAVHLTKFTQEIRLASPKSDHLEWQVGAYYTHESGSVAQQFTAYTLGTNTPAQNVPSLETLSLSSTYREIAAFGDATYHFGSHFDIQAGGRWSSNKQTAVEDGNGYFFAGVPIHFTAPSQESVFTYSVAPRWRIDANTMVYARVASGFRPGGPNIVPPLTPADVPRQYHSDSTVNYELGVRTAQLDGRLSLDVTAFHIDWKDIQLLELVDNTGVNGNGGRAVSQGVEVSAVVKPLRGLTLSFDGSYTDAKLTTSSPEIIGPVAGDRLPYVPRWSGSLDAEYDWNVLVNYTAFVGAQWAYVGDRSSDFVSGGGLATPLPSYNTVDLRIGLQDNRWLAELYVKNVSNAQGLTSVNTNVIAPGQTGAAYFAMPRTVGVLLSAKF